MLLPNVGGVLARGVAQPLFGWQAKLVLAGGSVRPRSRGGGGARREKHLEEPELHGLEAGCGEEEVAEVEEVELRRQRRQQALGRRGGGGTNRRHGLEHGQLGDQDALDLSDAVQPAHDGANVRFSHVAGRAGGGVAASAAANRPLPRPGLHALAVHDLGAAVDLVQNLLEPELVHLVDDDEEVLVVGGEPCLVGLRLLRRQDLRRRRRQAPQPRRASTGPTMRGPAPLGRGSGLGGAGAARREAVGYHALAYLVQLQVVTVVQRVDPALLCGGAGALGRVLGLIGVLVAAGSGLQVSDGCGPRSPRSSAQLPPPRAAPAATALQRTGCAGARAFPSRRT